jgi:pyruvate formate lyase activating enzyme
MYTPFLKNHILFSCGDHPGKLALIVYVNVLKCNLNCMDCHNKNEAKKSNETMRRMTNVQFKDRLFIGKSMGCELLVISGGEPTIYTEQIIEAIIENNVGLPIRIDTNGQFPESIDTLKKVANGFAIDIKIPILKKYTDEQEERFSKILGISDVKKYADNLRKVIRKVDAMPLTLYRTVKYPLLKKEDLTNINEFVATLKSPHYINDFVAIN